MPFDRQANVDLQRFWKTIEGSAKIGVGRPGGLARLSLTDTDREMRDLFADWCREAGLLVTIDEVGNMFARRDGTLNDLPPIFIGSHLDTQINGGRFDGIAGVLAGLEVCRTLNDLQLQTKRPIVVVNWTNEEGARFSPPMIASACFTGKYAADWVRDRIADDGARFGDELKRIGYHGDERCGGIDVDTYFELHIEQGAILDHAGAEMGVVVNAFPTEGMLVEFSGETAHTGPMPMELRKNALAAGARWLAAVDDIGWNYRETGGKATAARLSAWPNKPGILSETATAVCDIRHPDKEVARQMGEQMRQAALDAAGRNNCEVRTIDQWGYGGEIFDDGVVSLIRSLAVDFNVNWQDISSQAGHDAYHMATYCPTAMIFVPCKDGITHNNNESCSIEDFAAGLRVLLHAVVTRADR